MNSMPRPNPSSALKLKVELFDNASLLSRAAARKVVSELERKRNLLLCASAGGTPTGMYAQLAVLRAQQPRLFSRMRVLQIDEWAGLDSTSRATCKVDLEEKLLKPLHIPLARYFGFRTGARSPRLECHRVSRWLSKNGPIDICILGLGLNGHIAMNEPADALVPGVHCARLTESSRQHPMLDGLKKRPRLGFTLGLGDILRSRQILLLVSGSHKREILKKLMAPYVNTALPASFLWLHGNATVLCDREAAKDLRELTETRC